jgi:NitT/TauT family transport system substrate-binding protein
MRVFGGSGHRRRRPLRVEALAVAFFALSVSACGGGDSGSGNADADADGGSETAEEITLTVGYNKFWSTPPFFVGRQLGYFDDLPNVTVEWMEFDTPTAALAAMAAGDVDVLATPGPTLIQSRASGVDVVGVASLAGESEPAQYSFVAGADAGIDGVADLRGKTVGVNNYAGNFDLHLRYLLEQEGIDPEKDLNITPVPISAVVAGVLEGSIDVGAVVGAGSLMAEKEPGLVTVFTSTDVEPIQGQYSFMFLGMSQELVTEHRPAAVEFLTAYVRSIDHIVDQPDDALKLWATDTGIAIVEEMRAMNEFPDEGAPQASGLEFDMELLDRYGYVTQSIDLDELIDESLLEDARAEVDSAS